MLSAYGMTPQHPLYAELARGSRYPRVVMQRIDGTKVVVPINPDVVIYAE